MADTTYTLYIGPSPDGCSVQPYFEEGKHAALDEAQEHVERVTGLRMTWRWMEERRRWRAEAGWGRAAGISEESNGPASILIGISPMHPFK